jgi:ATP-dependent DNA ligase
MGKAMNSPYLEERSAYWQKMKPLQVGYFMAVGLTISDNREFRSIILARKTSKGFQYVSTVASGLSDKDVQTWYHKPACKIPQCPVPADVKVLQWLEPEQLKVYYYEQTKEGHLRFPRLTPSRPRFGI